MLSETSNILVFVAHAADWCFRAGGTAAAYAERGARVKVVCATFGERGESVPLWKDPTSTIQSVKDVRREEAITAAEILGVDIEFLDHDDNPLIIDDERLEIYVNLIRTFNPEIVLTHWTCEPTNQDHQIVGEAAIRAWGIARARAATLRDKSLPMPKYFLFEPDAVSAPVSGFVPDTYIDVTPVWERKLQALECFRFTQPGLLERWPAQGEMRGMEARNIGHLAGCRFAEAYRRFQPFAGTRFY